MTIEPSTLRRYSLFGGLLEDQIQMILPFMEKESYLPGEDIIVEGTPNGMIRFILEGRAAVLKNSIILSEFSEGDTFGEMEVLDVMPSAATIKALTHMTLMCVSNKGLRDIYKADASAFALVIMNLARDLSRRLRKMNERLIERHDGGNVP
ncbi:MAG: cyclic nucleotide-binding domain-containing protein [Treponema sp.]|jgi:CRP-like cAMP-binding protein|nr:cyclic nucleotide-binding domain-containing protein [Treponema sp.]